MVSPRTIAFTIPVLALGMLVSSWTRDDLAKVFRLNAPGWAPFAALAGFALVSTLWSAKPLTTIVAPLWLVFYLAISLLVMELVQREPRRNAFHLAEGLWLGMFVGLSYLLVEVLSNQAVKIFLYNALHVPKSWLRPAGAFSWEGNRLVGIMPMDLTRSIVPVTLLMWSALLALRTTAPRQAVKFWSLAFYVLAVAVIAVSDHETSKAAIIVSTIVFLLACWRSEWTRLLLQAGVVIACFGVVPVSLALHRFGLQTAPWIQESFQHRVALWNYLAESIAARPLFGRAAGMMYELRSIEGPVLDGKFDVQLPHAHSVFLQAWFELGVIGAVLLAIACVMMVRRIAQISGDYAPYGYATFAAAMTVGAASYGVWQPWFLGTFGLCASCYILALRVNVREGREIEQTPAPPLHDRFEHERNPTSEPLTPMASSGRRILGRFGLFWSRDGGLRLARAKGPDEDVEHGREY